MCPAKIAAVSLNAQQMTVRQTTGMATTKVYYNSNKETSFYCFILFMQEQPSATWCSSDVLDHNSQIALVMLTETTGTWKSNMDVFYFPICPIYIQNV